ncbi:NAD(P)/FAD-dependent oxidoreductase [Rhizobium sp. BK491]|uniref:FAD-dependent oxidoreductase n=1 Tax=unclassified Rhizobium TaxID=2613769 RepID=UPI000DD6D249|nr:NAD(P)/FAD-dependent oxidoreductase [Rhizobium sp. BK491]MBB3569218.1 2-polyprenyl-6-methoxyphenol hydroxylase-like FAD-dependent oxidoreductase [Rhizobium sp. BK491]
MMNRRYPEPSATETDTDIAIVGGGLSGTLTACLLGRAGYRVTLIDRHRVFPQEFRVEKIGRGEIEKLEQLQLLAPLFKVAAPFDDIVNLHRGRILDRTHGQHYGFFYNRLVGAMRAALPETVNFVVGQVTGLRTSAKQQRISILGKDELTARLLVLATGMGDMLHRDLGISHKSIGERRPLAFGFNIRPLQSNRFRHTALRYHGDGDGIDRLDLFPVADATRANLFLFRDPRDSWVRSLHDDPKQALIAAFPSLVDHFGDFEIASRIDSWLTEITLAENCRQDGVVLIGDAYLTSCPATGLGVSRLLTDVERLCRTYVPQWMTETAIDHTRIAAYYDDPKKADMDIGSVQMADRHFNLTAKTDVGWRLRRQFHITRRRILYGIESISPALAAKLHQLKTIRTRSTLRSAVLDSKPAA